MAIKFNIFKRKKKSEKNNSETPKEKKTIAQRVTGLIQAIVDDELDLQGRSIRIARRSVRTLVASVEKFLRDEALMRGTSISYALVVSFIPTLVVVLLVGARVINTDEYFGIAKEFVRKNQIPLDLDPYIKIIKELLKNAAAIGGVGFLVLLFSATSVLRNIENALNTIWRVHKARPLIQKLSGFLMVLIFGPVLLTIGISYAQWLLGQFASPDLKSIHSINSTIYATGEKRIYLKRDSEGKYKYENLVDRVDFDYQNETIIINPTNNTVVDDLAKKSITSKIKTISAKELKSATFIDLEKKGDLWWVITDNGTIIHSRDGGKLWHVKHFQREELNWLFPVRFHKIHMSSRNTGFIIGGGGLILSTSDGGRSWRPAYVENITKDLRDYTPMSQGRYMAVGDGFQAVISNDGGYSWQAYEPVMSLKESDSVSLSSVSIKGDIGWITGSSGTLLFSDDAGETFKRTNMSSVLDFNDVLVISENLSIMVGDNGDIRVTKKDASGLLHWVGVNADTTVNLVSITYDEQSKTILIAGDGYHIISSDKINSLNSNTLPLFTVVQKSPFWRKMISALGNFILPFVVIWMLFFLVYRVIPYTSVSSKAAAIGAATTSLIWVLFLLVFKYYLSSFSKGTFAIYGTLAAIPLTLLLIYVSSLIMLFGAEVAYFVQNPGMVKLSRKKLLDELEKRQIWYGMQILYLMIDSFYKGKDPVKESVLVRICNSDQEEFYSIIEKFQRRKIVQKTENDRWLLSFDPELIQLEDVIADLDPADYEIPEYNEKNPFMRQVKPYFDRVQQKRKEVFGGVTMGQLIKNSQQQAIKTAKQSRKKT